MTAWMGDAAERATVQAIRAGTTDAPAYVNVRCAWCGAMLSWVGDVYPVSHGICGGCAAEARLS